MTGASPPAPPASPRWAWSFLAIVAAGVVATVTIHLMRLPTGARGYYNRGVVDTREGRFESAMANFDRALEIDPKLSVARVARATAWLRAGRPYRALADANSALESDVASRACCVRGLALKRLGRLDDALASFTRSFTIDDDYGKAAVAKGDVLVEVARYGDALSAYRDASALRGFDDTLFLAPMLIWEARSLSGDVAGAETELRERVRAARGDADRLSPWVRLATSSAAPASGDDPAIASWIEAVKRLSAADRPGAIASLRASYAAAAPDSWVKDRAWSGLQAVALGFRVQPDDHEISSSFSFGPGVTVSWVRTGSAAGLAVDDRLVRVSGAAATQELVEGLATNAPYGSEVVLEFVRRGEPGTAKFVVGGDGAATPGSYAPTK